ncbi:MAG: glycosyltransferase family 4 protein [Rhodothermales bacterium]
MSRARDYPLRILMVLDHAFPPDVRVENEALSLIEAGFDVALLAVAPDDRPAREDYVGIRLFRDRISKELRNKMRGLAGTVPLYNWYLNRRIRQVYQEYPFDVLHVHDLYLFGGGLRAGHKLGVPIVGDLHENWVAALKQYAWSTRIPGKYFVSIPRWERLERKWVNAADRLVVVIDEMGERIRGLGVDPKKVTVVPNTIKYAAFERYEIEQELIDVLRSELTIVYTGSFDVHRGLASVLRAMPHVLAEKPNALFVIVGEGKIRPELEALAGALGITDRVRFEGWQPQARLKSYILASDVCLVPHLKTPQNDAGMPHKLFHYMYLERPVVVSNCRALQRIVEQTQTGLVYPAGDAEALARIILKIGVDQEAAQAMGRRGRDVVLERYHWDNTVRELIKMYEQLAIEQGQG